MDFNAGEIIALLVLAIVIFGPEKLPELARKSARVIAYVRGIANDARGQLRQELGPEFSDLSLSDLNPKAFVAKHLLGPEVTDEVTSVADDLRGAREQFDGAVAAPAGSAADEPEALLEEPRYPPFDPEAT